MWKKLVVLLGFLTTSLTTFAQNDLQAMPIQVWTTGQIDTKDQSVFYSVLFSSGATALTDVTIGAVLPAGATFVRDFWKPAVAEFQGVTANTVSWTLATVESNVVMGPFTFIVSFPQNNGANFTPPATFKATLTSSSGTVESEIFPATLTVLEEAGSLELDAAGVTDLTAVGNTGMWLFAPEGAVSNVTTLNFQRLPITEAMTLPAIANDTWWCGLFSLSATSMVNFAQPIILVVPLQRAATPGTVLPVFARLENSEWTLISGPNTIHNTFTSEDLQAVAFARVAPIATSAYVLLNRPQLTTQPVQLALGINTQIRALSMQTTEYFALPRAGGITDGTSNLVDSF